MPAANELFQGADSIEDLFAAVQDAIDQRVDKLQVEYDPSFGYPKLISIDPIENAVDEERGYTVSDFIPLR